MFDVGFSELMVIAVVALIVLGPERLPRAARMAGLWLRRIRAQWTSVKTDIERELAAEDLKRALAEARAELEATRHTAATSLSGDLTTQNDDGTVDPHAEHANEAASSDAPPLNTTHDEQPR